MFRGIILLLFIGLTTLSVCGDGLALYKQGATLFKSDPVQALDLFEQAATAGNVLAMVGAGHAMTLGRERLDFFHHRRTKCEAASEGR
ncbi:MAG: hypothetical protein V5783_07510 [Pontiella sp.]